MSRIWFSSIAAYADRYEIDDEDFDTFVTLVRALDDEFVSIEVEKQREEAAKNKQTE